MKSLIPTLRIVGKTLIKRYGLYCNIFLVCFFAFQGQCLAVFRSYGVNLPSSLTTLLPLALEFSSCPPVSVCGTGICFYTQSFSRLQLSVLPYSNFGPLRPGQPTPGSHPFEVSLCLNYRWLRNINRMCIGYAFRPDLSSRLTWSGRTFLQKP